MSTSREASVRSERRAAAIIPALLLLLCAPPLPAAPGDGPGPGAKVQQEVLQALESQGSVRVHIVLRGARPLPPRATAAQEEAHLKGVRAAHNAFRAAAPGRGLSILREFRWTRGLVAEVDGEALQRISRMAQVDLIYLDGEVRKSLTQGVPLIGGDAVQSSGITGAGVTVAILDSGINYNHAALGGCFGPGCKVVAGFDWVNNDADPMDDDGHGTAVAGIAASNGSGSVDVGVAPDADLAALKVLSASGSGTFADVDSALNWVLSNRNTYNIKVANLSLGEGGQYNNSNLSPCTGTNTANLVDSLVNNDVAVVVASGNEGHDNGVSFPACIASATAVGGVYDSNVGSVSWCGNSSCTTILCTDNPTFADKFVCHTNDGNPLDLLAPDYLTTTTSLSGGTTSFGGTSAAAPFVAGAYALMFEALPSSTVASIEGNFVSTGVSVTNPDNGQAYPRIDVEAAVQSFDADLDGLPDSSDNCPSVYNPFQEDDDGDGTGEACDNCPGLFNDTQANADGDPSGDACDCDDGNSAVYHGAPQVCDGVNNDCSDPNYPSLATESDDDGDGQAECAGDCDDSNPDRFAGNPEICDGLDNNCDFSIPSSESDSDMDGSRVCEGDCADNDPDRFPGNPEICDGVDNDCNLVIPADELDTDLDGYKTCEGDCDDGEAARFPGNPEICDGLDNDCDLVVPVGEENDDLDGFLVCQGDCDDSNPAVYPGAAEVCDGFNNDCNAPGWPSLSVESDDDGDGQAECAGDCDDTNPSVATGFAEICDGHDNDCDGATDPGFPYLASATPFDTLSEPGGAAANKFGSALLRMPDMTGDGTPDFAVGAPGWPSGSDTQGSLRLFSGSDRSSLMMAADPNGSSPGQMGASLATAGDVDGDSFHDLAGGSPTLSVLVGRLQQGRVVMFSGADGSQLWSYDDPSLASLSQLGKSLASLADVNGDGVREVITGVIKDCAVDFDCAGSAKILSGSDGQLLRTLTDATKTRNEEFGSSMASLGDMDSDGYDEVAVSAPLKDLSGKNATGEVRLYASESGSFLRAFIDPSSDPNDRLGTAVAAIEDLDGDGVLDLLAGAPGRDTGAGVDAGEVLLFSGATGSLIRRMSDPNGAAGDELGSSVAVVPDVTRDGVDDIVAGAPSASAGGQAGAGKIHLFDGATGAYMTAIAHSSPGANDALGSCVAALGSLDGDAVSEVAACVAGDDTADGSDAGTVAIYSPVVLGDCDGDGTENGSDTCTDSDGDGAGSGVFLAPTCPLDCDDSNPLSYPGAPQICDGVNNDCLDPLYPAVSPDECFAIPDLYAEPAGSDVLLDWTPPAGGADQYRIYRGTRGDLEAGVNGGFCFQTTTADTLQFTDPAGPGVIVYYVVAGVRSQLEGSRGQDFDGNERVRGDLCP